MKRVLDKHSVLLVLLTEVSCKACPLHSLGMQAKNVCLEMPIKETEAIQEQAKQASRTLSIKPYRNLYPQP